MSPTDKFIYFVILIIIRGHVTPHISHMTNEANRVFSLPLYSPFIKIGEKIQFQ